LYLVIERPAHAGLRHLALNVRALEAMKRFYVDLLGFGVEWEPDADNVYLTSGRDNLALHRGTGVGQFPSDSRPPSQSPLDHLGVIVKTADDVDRWAAFLESRGVTLDAKPKTHRDGARSCYVSDPDGNKVQIIYHPPISGRI
jgi:catechol 2,3-dioxygenase-like lactoylglutathione lyase family enzyme